MNKKYTHILAYTLLVIIYIGTFAFIISDMFESREGRILLFIYSTSIILTIAFLYGVYRIGDILIYIMNKLENKK